MQKDLSVKQKWAYLAQHFQNTGKKSGGTKKITMTPEYFVTAIQQHEPDAEMLISLRVCLTTESMEFSDGFIARNGVGLLLAKITEMEKQKESKLLRELIRCVMALLRNKKGMNAVLSNGDSLKRLVLCVEKGGDADTNVLVLDMMAVLVNTEPQYYDQVMEAWQYYKIIRHEHVLFYTLVVMLRDDDRMAVKIAVLRCLNGLVSAPNDLDLRMTNRTALKRLGIMTVIDTVYAHNPGHPEFALERQTFLEDAKEDDLLLADLLPSFLFPGAKEEASTSFASASTTSSAMRAQVAPEPASAEEIEILKKELEIQAQDFQNIRNQLQLGNGACCMVLFLFPDQFFF